MNEWIVGICGSVLAGLQIFILERLFSLSAKVSKVKAEIFEELAEPIQKQVKEGINAHKRIDVLDRLVSASTDREFNSSKNIAGGSEEIPSTVVIRRVVQKYSREI